MKFPFPFSAIVGQEEMKQAIENLLKNLETNIKTSDINAEIILEIIKYISYLQAQKKRHDIDNKTVTNYLQAQKLGCHIITVPPSTIEKIEKFGKTYKKLTIETVKGFLINSKKSNFKIN